MLSKNSFAEKDSPDKIWQQALSPVILTRLSTKMIVAIHDSLVC